MKFLIVNADDFGLEEEVNNAVELACQEGILTSTSLLAGGNAFEKAIVVAERNPQLGVGVHTALVGGIKPVLQPSEIPSLVDENGLLLQDYGVFLKKDLRGEINYQEVYRELEAQFEKIQSTGLKITHADGHQHLHIWPKVLPIVVSLCKKYKISCMRIPEEDIRYGRHLANFSRFLGKTGLSVLAARARKVVLAEGIVTTDKFWGMMDGGKLTERRLLNIIRSLPDGFHEIMCHPGVNNITMSQKYSWGYHWQDELLALTSPDVYRALINAGIHRINYGDLYHE